MMDWTYSGDTDAVAETWDCYPFEIVRLAESMDRLLMAVASVQRLLDPEPEEGEERTKSPQLLRIELLRQMVINGVGPEAASLTSIEGIGSKWARKLVATGIRSLDHLAKSKTSELVSLGKITEKRAEKWIRAARIADKRTGADSDAGASIPVYPSSSHLEVDPYRLRRAKELNVAPLKDNLWQVTGGLEPHRVDQAENGLHCDCHDFAKGNTCKHILAVRLHLGDEGIQSVASGIEQASSGDFLDLTQLWFSR